MKIIISSSISNWKEKIEKKLKGYNGKATRFYGLYHEKDYVRFLECKGKQEVYWQGSDILQLKNTEQVKWIEAIKYSESKHYCENEVQQELLKEKGIKAQVKYQFWNDVKDYPLSYIHSVNPNIWLCAHPGREIEYGVPIVDSLSKELPNFTFHIYGIIGENRGNVTYHGIVDDKQFDEEIKNYQGALRLNAFDGISEVITKGSLLGQYVISTIKYPCVSRFATPEQLLYTLKRIAKQKYPNYRARNYFLNIFK
jgi:hypothetical protein